MCVCTVPEKDLVKESIKSLKFPTPIFNNLRAGDFRFKKVSL